MSKALRLSEKWFQRGLWLVALLFAYFLIGLGNRVVKDLPLVQERADLDHFIDGRILSQLKNRIEMESRAIENTSNALEQSRLQHQKTLADSASAQVNLDNWVATRSATQDAAYNLELTQRTSQLEAIKARERDALSLIQVQEATQLAAQQNQEAAQSRLERLRSSAQTTFDAYNNRNDLNIFLLRLALTLPLLLLAAWLFVRYRRGAWWPFVWGFVFFAGFAFFVELVPYLPSYGGYVRYGVGVVMTVVIGRYAIASLESYLKKQKLAEAQSDVQRRQTLSYDTALVRLSKAVCPGCERGIDLRDEKNDFCPHCGMGIFHACRHANCGARKSAFTHFCYACGAQDVQNLEVSST